VAKQTSRDVIEMCLQGSKNEATPCAGARTDDVPRVQDCGKSRNYKNDSLLDEGAAHLIGDRLEQIAHHRPASRLHENLGRHSRHELLTG
jgi:hypothetical protein